MVMVSSVEDGMLSVDAVFIIVVEYHIDVAMDWVQQAEVCHETSVVGVWIERKEH